MSDNKPAWGGAPQSSDTGHPNWGGAPQSSDTGRPNWGGAPQSSNTGTPYMNMGFTEVPEYPEYRIEGVFYRVIRLISGISGEAKIFEIEADGRHFALKLYRPGVHPNHDVLAKVKTLNGNGLLIDIFAHGVWTDGNTGVPYDYEIMEYCGGGSLSACRLEGDEAKMTEYAVKMAAALDLAHTHGILHRDVKPANFLFTDESHTRFVLTDWGLAKTLDSKGRAVTDAGRTKIYAAPEMYTYIPGTPTYVNSKADFFSMGMTLLALWMGEGLLLADETELVKKKQEEMLPYPREGEMSARLLSLIKDLTRRNPDVRAGFDDVARWAKEPIDPDNSDSAGDSDNTNNSNSSEDSDNTDDYFWFLSPEEVIENPESLKCISSLEDLQIHLINNGYFKNIEYLLNDDFLLWLARRNPELAGKAKIVVDDPKIDDSIKLYTLLYTILPDTGWDFMPIKETEYSEPSQYVTPEQLADVIVPEIKIPEDKNAEAEIVIYSTDDVQAYFRAREKYSKYADWIEYCLEFDSDDNQKKFVPYDDLTAAFKVASGLKGEPVDIEINGEKVAKPFDDSLLDFTGDNMQPEYRDLPKDTNVQDYIAAWLTLFYQEGLNADYEKESYFSRSRRYYEFVKKNLPFSNIAKNASQKAKVIKEAQQRLNYAKSRLKSKAKTLRWIVTLPLIFTIIAWIGLLIFMGPSKLVASLKAQSILFSVLTALLPGVITSFYSDSFLRGGIVGVLIFVVLWLVFPYIAVALPWIFLIWIVFQLLPSIWLLTPNEKDSDIASKYSDFTLEEGCIRAEMAEAFSNRDKLLPDNLPDDYPEVVYKKMKDKVNGEREDLVSLFWWLFLLSLLSCAWPLCLLLL